MTECVVFTGNIGCGKSLFASKLAKMGSVVVNMDSIQQMVSGGAYGQYDKEKKAVYWAAETATIEEALKSNLSVVIDRTNMDRKCRERFISIGKKHGAKIVSYNWGGGTEHDLWRRFENSRGVSEETWRNVFEYMQKSYEPPSIDEGFDTIIEPPKKFKFYAFDFDGTIVKNKFPEIGEIINGTVDKMNALWESLANIIIVWSCRGGSYSNLMREFIVKNKIPFDFINENPIFNMGSPKVFAHEYYDDRNVTI